MTTSSMPLNLLAVPIAVLWLYATLVLAERRSGYVIILLASLLGAYVPWLHFHSAKGVAGGSIAGPSGALLWVWTLIALGSCSSEVQPLVNDLNALLEGRERAGDLAARRDAGAAAAATVMRGKPAGRSKSRSPAPVKVGGPRPTACLADCDTTYQSCGSACWRWQEECFIG